MVFSYLACHKHCLSFCAYRILQTFSTKNVWTLVKAYTSMLDRNLSVTLLFGQKKFTWLICNQCNMPFDSYFDRVNELDIRSLEYRRLKFDLMFIYL